MSDRFEELVGDVQDPRERERLRRVHELLLSVEPPPELSRPPHEAAAPPRRSRRRTYALVAAMLAIALFGAGYLLGTRDVEPERVIAMAGVADERDASASIELLPQDEAGNWPMHLLVHGLEPSSDRLDYYELWLTQDGERIASCGRFVVADGGTEVRLSVPYGLRNYDGWIVTRAGSDEVLLTT